MNKILSQSLIDYLNELMSEKNITVAQVAKNSGIGEYVYKIFNGERNAKRDTLLRFHSVYALLTLKKHSCFCVLQNLLFLIHATAATEL